MQHFKSLLVVAPHCDDEVLGCGGLISKMRRQGMGVTILIVNPETEARCEEAQAAAEILGVSDVRFGPLTPRGLDTLTQRELIGLIEDQINWFRPNTVAIPSHEAAHQDHRAVAWAGMAACRPAGNTAMHRPPIVLGWEEAADAWPPMPSSPPSLAVSLDRRDVATKIAAMAAHYSQVRMSPSERSDDAIEALARLRGVQAGVDYAEGYSVLRWLV
jgi:LmbE family N-acetylglucosaminyl deacetylase